MPDPRDTASSEQNGAPEGASFCCTIKDQWLTNFQSLSPSARRAKGRHADLPVDGPPQRSSPCSLSGRPTISMNCFKILAVNPQTVSPSWS